MSDRGINSSCERTSECWGGSGFSVEMETICGHSSSRSTQLHGPGLIVSQFATVKSSRVRAFVDCRLANFESHESLRVRRPFQVSAWDAPDGVASETVEQGRRNSPPGHVTEGERAGLFLKLVTMTSVSKPVPWTVTVTVSKPGGGILCGSVTSSELLSSRLTRFSPLTSSHRARSL
jgi:hypothetical protein